MKQEIWGQLLPRCHHPGTQGACVYVAEASKSLDPTLGQPSHKLLADGRTLRACYCEVLQFNERSPVLAIKKANGTVRCETAIVAVPYIGNQSPRLVPFHYVSNSFLSIVADPACNAGIDCPRGTSPCQAFIHIGTIHPVLDIRKERPNVLSIKLC